MIEIQRDGHSGAWRVESLPCRRSRPIKLSCLGRNLTAGFTFVTPRWIAKLCDNRDFLFCYLSEDGTRKRFDLRHHQLTFVQNRPTKDPQRLAEQANQFKYFDSVRMFTAGDFRFVEFLDTDKVTAMKIEMLPSWDSIRMLDRLDSLRELEL